jgi:hypothetical protein
MHPDGFDLFLNGNLEQYDPNLPKIRGRVQFCTAPEVRKYCDVVGFRIYEERLHLELIEQDKNKPYAHPWFTFWSPWAASRPEHQ